MMQVAQTIGSIKASSVGREEILEREEMVEELVILLRAREGSIQTVDYQADFLKSLMVPMHYKFLMFFLSSSRDLSKLQVIQPLK